MKDANAPNFLWADTLATVVYAINRTAGSWSGSVTPFEAFFGEKPDVSHMWVWYADIFIHQPKGLGGGKLGECSHRVKFLGYPENSAGYKTYDLHTHKVQVVHAPIFREEAHPVLLSSFKSIGNDSNTGGDPDDIPPDSTDPLAVSVTTPLPPPSLAPLPASLPDTSSPLSHPT